MYEPNREMMLLYPPFRDLLSQGLATAHARQLQAFMFEGTRISARQAWLYGQGRDRPGPVVTNAEPGNSWHEYGLAADLVFDGLPAPGVQWSWDGDYVGTKKDDYLTLGALLTSRFGLEWYGSPSAKFHELPHFQKTWNLTLTKAKALKAKGGLIAVWSELDKILKGDL